MTQLLCVSEFNLLSQECLCVCVCVCDCAVNPVTVYRGAKQSVIVLKL
jgi:hypothetical protein